MAIVTPYGILGLMQAKLTADLQHFLPLGERESIQVPVVITDSVDNIPKNTPLAVVLMSGGIDVEEESRRQASIIETVVVIVAARDASTQLTGEGASSSAGLLMKKVFECLFKWEPNDGYGRLSMINTIGTQHEAGYGYFPIAFTTQYVLTGVN